MKNKILLGVISFILIMVGFGSCYKDPYPDHFPIAPIYFEHPPHFPEPFYNFKKNPITTPGFQLGKKLFYDVRLSRNLTISCGSCHIQTTGFSHHGHDVSHGIEDRLGMRNTPATVNLAYMPHFNWDGGIFDLDFQPIAPITAHEEMDADLDIVMDRIRKDPLYQSMFEQAFRTEEIELKHMLKALSQFMTMIVSAQSKYDSVMLNLGPEFTEIEHRGYILFKEHCNSCHKAPLFTDHSFRNNGMGIGTSGDKGRFEVTQNPEDLYKFRVPSLRNLRFTAPYMHDGRFYTLQVVLDHYANEVQDMPTLDPLLRNVDGTTGILLTREEKEAIIAFINTLNDRTLIRDKRFSEGGIF